MKSGANEQCKIETVRGMFDRNFRKCLYHTYSLYPSPKQPKSLRAPFSGRRKRLDYKAIIRPSSSCLHAGKKSPFDFEIDFVAPTPPLLPNETASQIRWKTCKDDAPNPERRVSQLVSLLHTVFGNLMHVVHVLILSLSDRIKLRIFDVGTFTYILKRNNSNKRRGKIRGYIDRPLS